jgi:hypothetical protein
MKSYRLIEDHYVLPTPAGAYTAVAHQSDDPLHRLLGTLLRHETTPLLTQQALERWTGQPELEAQESLYLAQSQAWIEGFAQPKQSPGGTLETLLPDQLSGLADSGKVLLADARGLCVASTGFTREASLELSAFSTDIAALDRRHDALLQQNLRHSGSAWARVDAAGNSQVGFWPLYIEALRFVLVLQGQPHFNQPAFTELVWTLSTRCAAGELE